MRPPIRVVCIDCLQSVEISGSVASNPSENCPHCGAFLDPYQAGIQSRPGFAEDSPETLEYSDLSTLRSDLSLVGPSRQIGRFQIRLALGEGGYGQVFRAFDPHLEREVALKVLKPNRLGQKAIERFYREARAAARLDHPNIVGLHDAGRDEGRCWIAYQLVSGRTLSALRDMARPSVIESVRIVRDLALGLHHAHSRGVYHRDLKPANIMIDDAGRPRLTDFGLARRDDIESDLTTEGTVLGTPQYMSPEAAAGRAHEADARSDVYSLGVILYELICGRRPCDVPSGAPLWRSIHQSTPPTPRSVDRAISPMLDRICMKALALDPDDRYASANLLAEALTEQIAKHRPGRVPLASIEGLARITRPRFHRWRRPAAALGFVLTFLATLALAVPRSSWPETPIAPATTRDVTPPAVDAHRLQETMAHATPDDVARPAVEATVEVTGDTAESAPVPAESTGTAVSPVIVSKKSGDRIYHAEARVGVTRCKVMPTNQVRYSSADEAVAHQYRPCKICYPGSR